MFFCPCQISLWEFMLFSCIIILCDFMLLGCYEISIWDFGALREISWFWDRFEISCFMAPTRFPCANCCCLLLNFLMRFHAFCPLWDFLMRLYAFCMYIFRMRFPFEILCFLLHSFLVRCPFWLLWDVPVCDFMLFAALFSYEIS